MNFPIWETRPCQDRSSCYIVGEKVYVWHIHKATKYFSHDSIQLLPPDSIRLLLNVVDQCRKELLVSPKTQRYLDAENEYNGFDATIKEGVKQIFSRLSDAVWNKKFFELEALFQEAKLLEEFIMNDKLFVKHSTAKCWDNALGVVEGTVEKSVGLVRKELREQYDSLFKRTADGLKKQRNRILEEKSRLEIQLSEEKNRVKDLKEELKTQKESYKQDMKRQKEEYEEKTKDLINTQSQLEQTKAALINDAEQRDQQISELKEDILSKSDNLERSHERIQKLEQKVKAKTEQKKELKERIKKLKNSFAEEKEKLEENHESELRQHKRYNDIIIEESHEKHEKELQEQLSVFNNKYKEKDDAILKLQEEMSELTADLDHERTEHQALIATHTNFEEEKQSIVIKHAEDTSKLEQNNAALEEESKAKDISIMKFKEEIEELINKLDAADERNKLFKQDLASSIETFWNQEVTALLKDSGVYDVYGGEIKFDQKACLILGLKNISHLEFLVRINKRIPDWQRININSVSGENEAVKTFLRLYFPNKVGSFYFNSNSEWSDCLSFYMDELEELGPKVEKDLWIYNFEVSQHQMATLLSANKHKSRIGFDSCNLALSSVPDFGGALQGSTVETLDLSGWGCSARGDWENNPSHFENLVEGLAKEEDFKSNLKHIRMWSWGMEKSQVVVILRKYQFRQVEILGC